MLDPMQQEVAIEVISTIRAYMFNHQEVFGDSEQLELDRNEILAFRSRIRFESEGVEWHEVIEFSRYWQEQYPKHVEK